MISNESNNLLSIWDVMNNMSFVLSTVLSHLFTISLQPYHSTCDVTQLKLLFTLHFPLPTTK